MAPLAAVFLAVSAGASIIGGITARRGASSQASRTEEQAALQAAAARQNARFELALGERNAEAAILQAAAEEERLRTDRERRISSTRAQFGASGGQLQGSALDVIADQVMTAEEDALLIRFGGEQAAQQARLTGAILARRELLDALGVETTGQLRADALRASGTASLLRGVGSALGTATQTALLVAK